MDAAGHLLVQRERRHTRRAGARLRASSVGGPSPSRGWGGERGGGRSRGGVPGAGGSALLLLAGRLHALLDLGQLRTHTDTRTAAQARTR